MCFSIETYMYRDSAFPMAMLNYGGYLMFSSDDKPCSFLTYFLCTPTPIDLSIFGHPAHVWNGQCGSPACKWGPRSPSSLWTPGSKTWAGLKMGCTPQFVAVFTGKRMCLTITLHLVNPQFSEALSLSALRIPGSQTPVGCGKRLAKFNMPKSNFGALACPPAHRHRCLIATWLGNPKI